MLVAAQTAVIFDGELKNACAVWLLLAMCWKLIWTSGAGWLDRGSHDMPGNCLSCITVPPLAGWILFLSFLPYGVPVCDSIVLAKGEVKRSMLGPFNCRSVGDINLDDKLYFVEEPLEIVGREVKWLKRSRIPLVKVRWNSKRGPEFTWEREDQFKKKYPHLFTKTVPSSSAAS
ncbi:hypothetical protein Tco_0738978 [Tanacetum coccineum]